MGEMWENRCENLRACFVLGHEDQSQTVVTAVAAPRCRLKVSPRATAAVCSDYRRSSMLRPRKR